MQELVYSLNYVLECMDLMRSWVDIEVEKVSMCNLCGDDCESVGHFLWNCPVYSERRALFLEHIKNNLGKEFEHFKSYNIGGKSQSFGGVAMKNCCA